MQSNTNTISQPGVLEGIRLVLAQVIRDGVETTGRPVKAKDAVTRAVAILYPAGLSDLEKIKKTAVIRSELSSRYGELWDRPARAFYAPMGWSKKERAAA